MRILMACSGVYPDEIGGAHTYVYELSRHLARRGHELTVIAANTNNEFPSEEVIEGIRYVRYPYRQSSDPLRWRYRLSRGACKAFASISQQQQFDVIHGHWPHSSSGVFSHPQAKNALKVYTFHAPFFEEEQVEASTLLNDERYTVRNLLKALWVPLSLAEKKRREEKVLRQADLVITLSNFMRERAIRIFRLPGTKISVIPGGVDLDRFVPSDRPPHREHLGVPANTKLLLTVRRLVPRMGLANLIKAMAVVRKQISSAALYIGGSGTLLQPLKDLIRKLNLEDCVFLLGHVPSQDLSRWYNAADLFVLPTEFLEGFGLATVEALACGTPVLGTPVGGTGEILSGLDPSMLLSGTAPEDIAAGIVNYLENSTDEQRSKAVDFVHQRYGWSTIAEQVEYELIEKIKECRR